MAQQLQGTIVKINKEVEVLKGTELCNMARQPLSEEFYLVTY